MLPALSLGGQRAGGAALENCLSLSPGVATYDQEQVTGLLNPVEMGWRHGHIFWGNKAEPVLPLTPGSS